jgi:hypothetical protein
VCRDMTPKNKQPVHSFSRWFGKKQVRVRRNKELEPKATQTRDGVVHSSQGNHPSPNLPLGDRTSGASKVAKNKSQPPLPLPLLSERVNNQPLLHSTFTTRNIGNSNQSHGESRKKYLENKKINRNAHAAYLSSNNLNSFRRGKGLLQSLNLENVKLIGHINIYNAEALGSFQNYIVSQAIKRTRLSKEKGIKRDGGGMANLDDQIHCFAMLLESGGKFKNDLSEHDKCKHFENFGIKPFSLNQNDFEIKNLALEAMSLCKKIGSSIARINRFIKSEKNTTSKRFMNCAENPDKEEGIIQALERASRFAGAMALEDKHIGHSFWSHLQNTLNLLAHETKQRCLTIHGTQGTTACTFPPQNMCFQRRTRRGLSHNTSFHTNLGNETKKNPLQTRN